MPPAVLESHLSALTKVLEGQPQNRHPLPKPDTFNGDPLKFPTWLKAFETVIETREINPTERLHFLKRYVGGEAKEHIDGWRGCQLVKRYGDSFAVSAAFRKKLETWPHIQCQDNSITIIALRRVCRFLSTV